MHGIDELLLLLCPLHVFCRETIEAIFQQLSAGCRSEMEAEMETDMDTKSTHSQTLSGSQIGPEAGSETGSEFSSAHHVSDACRQEIQDSASRMAGKDKKGKGTSRRSSSSSSSQGKSRVTGTSTEADKTDSTDSSTQSVLLVVAALVLLFGAVAGYVIYVNVRMMSQQGIQKKSTMRKKVSHQIYFAYVSVCLSFIESVCLSLNLAG
jgi:cobalamin biosynthesis Mg chelatase CobN